LFEFPYLLIVSCRNAADFCSPKAFGVALPVISNECRINEGARDSAAVLGPCNWWALLQDEAKKRKKNAVNVSQLASAQPQFV